jgi:ketosteroid isomerase-like protein
MNMESKMSWRSPLRFGPSFAVACQKTSVELEGSRHGQKRPADALRSPASETPSLIRIAGGRGMHRTFLAVLIVLRCSLLFGQSPAGPPAPERERWRAEAEIRQILEDLAVGQRSNIDAKELERFYADEFTSINASGQVQNRAAIIAARASGRISAQSYQLEEVVIQIYGDIAVARTSSRIEGNTASGRFRHLRVFIKRDGRWQIIATQMTKIAEQ